MGTILFSIIIPHRNIPVLLQRCIDSIPLRDDIQTIVVDDNSDVEIVDFTHFPGLNRPNTEVYFTKEGKGAGYARNVGLQHAQGQWVLFADADDFFTPKLNQVLEKYSHSVVDAVLFPIDVVDSESLLPANRDTWLNRMIYSGSYTDREKLLLCVAPWTKLIRRDLIEANHIRFDEVKYSNDAIFSTLVGIHARTVHIDTDDVIYTLTERSCSLTKHVTKEALRTRLDVEMRRYKLIRQHGYGRCHFQNYKKILLLWSGNFGLIELLRTLSILAVNGYLFINYDSEIGQGFQNSVLYSVLHATRHALLKK